MTVTGCPCIQSKDNEKGEGDIGMSGYKIVVIVLGYIAIGLGIMVG